MILLVDCSNMFLVHMRVNLGCCYIGVAQHFLNTSQIGAALQQVRSKTVSQGMRADLAD